MSAKKEEAIQLIRELPEDSSLTDILAGLYFKQKVEEGLADIESGRTITHEEVRQRMVAWATL